MWNYTESSQIAAHITNCKNVDFKSSPLTACYLNCSTTFHMFKNLTDLQKSRTKTKSGNRPNQILPTASLYARMHTPTLLLLHVKSKTGFHRQIHSFWFFPLIALHLPFQKVSVTFATAKSYAIQVFPLGDKRSILPGKKKKRGLYMTPKQSIWNGILELRELYYIAEWYTLDYWAYSYCLTTATA